MKQEFLGLSSGIRPCSVQYSFTEARRVCIGGKSAIDTGERVTPRVVMGLGPSQAICLGCLVIPFFCLMNRSVRGTSDMIYLERSNASSGIRKSELYHRLE